MNDRIIRRATVIFVLAAAGIMPCGAAAGDMKVRTIREPVFVDVRLSVDSSSDANERTEWIDRAATAVSRAMSETETRSLLALRINGGAPTYRQALRHHGIGGSVNASELAAFEREAANRLSDLLDRIHDEHAGLGVSVLGLPVEAGSGSSDEAARINERFEDVLARLDAFITSKGMIVDGGLSELSALKSSHDATMSLHNGRPIVFRSNGVWRVAGNTVGQELHDVDLQRDSSRDEERRVTSESRERDRQDSSSSAQEIPTIVWGPDDAVLAESEIGLELASMARVRDYDDLFQRHTAKPDEGYLIPGDGWHGRTQQPDPVGDPENEGYEAKAVARWDAIPHQTFPAQYEIGVVAFHLSGIDRVDFAVDGGEWLSVDQMRLNPRTNVWEYFAILRASDFADGLLEVRAIVYPTHGIPRVLAGEITNDSVRLGEHSMILAANRGGSLPGIEMWVSPDGDDERGNGSEGDPFRTIMRAVRAIADRNRANGDGDNADGGIINLTEGEHNYGDYQYAWRTDTIDRWLTIRRAPNADRNQVRLTTSEGGLQTHLVHLEEVTVDGIRLETGLNAFGGPPTLWLDKCILRGHDRLHDIYFAGVTEWIGGIYATDCTFSSVKRAIQGYILTRNCEITDIGVDAFKDPRMVINCEVSHIDATGLIEHADAMQFFGNHENVIVYGFAAVEDIGGQPFFARRNAQDVGQFTNSAFVNYIAKSNMHGQWLHDGDHVLFYGFQLLGQPFLLRDDGDIPGHPGRLARSSIRQSILEELRFTLTGTDIDRVDICDNHFIEGESAGERGTIGNPRFWDPQAFDYRPRPGSPLLDRLMDPLVPADITNMAVEPPAAIGAVQPADFNRFGDMLD